MIGAFATIFAYTLYYNFLGIQTTLNMPSSDVHLYMLILIIFGMLSIISGLLLAFELKPIFLFALGFIGAINLICGLLLLAEE